MASNVAIPVFPFTEIKPDQVSGLIVNTSNYLTGAASTSVSGEGVKSSFIADKSDASRNKKMSFIMRLKQGTDFEVSFSIE